MVALKRRIARKAPQRAAPTREGREAQSPGPQLRSVPVHFLRGAHHHDMILAGRQRAGWFAIMTGDSDLTSSDLSPGRMDDGFLLLARDLSRAIAVARFSPAQHLLIQQAIEESYGKARLKRSAEPEPFRLNVSAIAKVGGFARPYLAQQHLELVACGLIVKDGNLCRINKDYRQWKDAKGEPRLSEDAVAWCRDGKIRKTKSSCIPDTLSCIPDTLPTMPHVMDTGQCVMDTGQTVMDTGQSNDRGPSVHCQEYMTPSVMDTRQSEVAPPGPPLGERTRGDLETFKIKTPVAPNGASRGTGGGDSLPQTPDPEQTSPERLRGEVHALILRATGDEITAERIGAMAAAWHRDEGFGPGAIIASLNAIMADPKSTPRSWGTYAHRTLCGMRERSKADAAAPIAPRGSQGPSRPRDLPLPPEHKPDPRYMADYAAERAARLRPKGPKP